MILQCQKGCKRNKCFDLACRKEMSHALEDNWCHYWIRKIRLEGSKISLSPLSYTEAECRTALLLMMGLSFLLLRTSTKEAVFSVGNLFQYLQSNPARGLFLFSDLQMLIIRLLRRIKSCLFWYWYGNTDEVWAWDLGAPVPCNTKKT